MNRFCWLPDVCTVQIHGAAGVVFVGFLLPAVLLIATGYVDCNAPLAVFLIITAVGFSGISFAGWSVNHLDLAPQYAG